MLLYFKYVLKDLPQHVICNFVRGAYTQIEQKQKTCWSIASLSVGLLLEPTAGHVAPVQCLLLKDYNTQKSTEDFPKELWINEFAWKHHWTSHNCLNTATTKNNKMHYKKNIKCMSVANEVLTGMRQSKCQVCCPHINTTCHLRRYRSSRRFPVL